MKLNCEFIVNEIADSFVAVPMGTGNATDNNCIIKVNDVGAAILECLKEDTTVEAIADVLCSKFEGTREEAVATTTEFIENLKKAGFVE